MSAPAVLMACVARAAVRKVGNFLTFGLAGDILVDTWDAWHKQKDEAARRKEVEALAAATGTEARDAARQALADVPLPDPESKQRLEDCLANIPATIRRSLRSVADPSGRTLPPARRLDSAEALGMVLPLMPTRFKAGDQPLPGTDWVLSELLGVGGYGEVWKAVNPNMSGQAVALKFCTDPTARQRLLKHEAGIVARLQQQRHLPGIVPLLDTYLSADPPCLKFEYVEGGDLGSLIRNWHASGSVPDTVVIAGYVRDLAAIVGQAHRMSQPVVHRDLKPANVLVRGMRDGRPELAVADFGIGGLAAAQAVEEARRGTLPTGPATVLAGSHTPLYASPQQMAGGAPDPRDDVYSLGVIWYQMLTGDLRKGAPTGDGWKRRLLERGMPGGLVNVLSAALEHEQEDRPADAGALAEMIGGPPTSAASEAAPFARLSAAPVQQTKRGILLDGLLKLRELQAGQRLVGCGPFLLCLVIGVGLACGLGLAAGSIAYPEEREPPRTPNVRKGNEKADPKDAPERAARLASEEAAYRAVMQRYRQAWVENGAAASGGVALGAFLGFGCLSFWLFPRQDGKSVRSWGLRIAWLAGYLAAVALGGWAGYGTSFGERYGWAIASMMVSGVLIASIAYFVLTCIVHVWLVWGNWSALREQLARTTSHLQAGYLGMGVGGEFDLADPAVVDHLIGLLQAPAR